MENLVSIGCDPKGLKINLPHIAKFLLQILASPAGDEVKKTAIEEFFKQFKPENIMFSSCNFVGGKTHTKSKAQKGE